MPTEIHLMSGYAPKTAFLRLVPQFEQQTGFRPIVHYNVLGVIREKIAAGERPDILIMPVGLLDGYAKENIVRGDARAALGTVRTAIAAKAGARAPDLSSMETFRDALLAARAVAHSPATATPSGAHCAKMMEQLGIADAMAKKTIYLPALEGGLQAIQKGEADFGIYPKSEVVNVEGVRVVGLLPPGVEFNNVYGAAVVTGSAVAEAAAAFVRYLGAPENRQVWADVGFDPPGS